MVLKVMCHGVYYVKENGLYLYDLYCGYIFRNAEISGTLEVCLIEASNARVSISHLREYRRYNATFRVRIHEGKILADNPNRRNGATFHPLIPHWTTIESDWRRISFGIYIWKPWRGFRYIWMRERREFGKVYTASVQNIYIYIAEIKNNLILYSY